MAPGERENEMERERENKREMERESLSRCLSVYKSIIDTERHIYWKYICLSVPNLWVSPSLLFVPVWGASPDPLSIVLSPYPLMFQLNGCFQYICRPAPARVTFLQPLPFSNAHLWSQCRGLGCITCSLERLPWGRRKNQGVHGRV